MSVKFHEAYALDSQQDQLLWWDDFLGDQVQDEWDIFGTGNGVVVDQQTGGIIRITSGALTGNFEGIYWQDVRSLLVTKRASAEFRVKLSSTSNIEVLFSIRFDANDQVHFEYDTGAAHVTWHILTVDGGATTDNDSGVAPDTDYHIFRIECHTHGGNHAHFYIDGTETANSPITTNIPDDATDYLQPFLRVRTREDNTRHIDADYVVVRQDI